jgi:hypothetical protein
MLKAYIEILTITDILPYSLPFMCIATQIIRSDHNQRRTFGVRRRLHPPPEPKKKKNCDIIHDV